MKRLRPVVFDVDGVLANFIQGYNRIAEEMKKPVLTPDEWSDWDPDVRTIIKESPDFWRTLKPLVDADTFNRINNLNHDVYFVTSRFGFHAKDQTESWLQWKGIYRPTVILSPHKSAVCACVKAAHVIEDHAPNVESISVFCKGETQAYVLDYPHNRRPFLGSVVRVKSVDEFLDIVAREALEVLGQEDV